VEEPGYQAARAVFASRGARVVPCRVDRDGLVVEELPAGLRLVYTTPAHQYPLGGRLPVPRRQALAAWARATGALIVEDDYDGEFRYDVAPLPTLFGLDPDAVIYLGTTSKTLTPALGAGWLVARRDLIPVLTEAAADLGERVSGPVQHAVTELLASGELERHVRRMRHEYARRRAVLVAALGSRLTGDTAGMHMVLELPPGTAAALVAAARERGVEVATLDRYFAGPPAREGLVLGYGAADLAAVSRGGKVIAEIVAALPGARGAGVPR
jgi:GntR family transcriptional regulator/MocR family aminotransferase